MTLMNAIVINVVITVERIENGIPAIYCA